MAEKKWFIPTPGSTVRDPLTKAIVPAEGREVEDTVYWRRRVVHGDGTYGTAPVTPVPSTDAPAAEKPKSAKKD